MKMRWEEPRIEVQQFMPNEYDIYLYSSYKNKFENKMNKL